MANTSAIAVSAFSPPESRWMVWFFLPGGCAITCTPASRISSPVITRRALPPPNSSGNILPKWVLTVSKVLPSRSRVSLSIFLIASSSVFMASTRSADCASRKVLRSLAAVSSSSAARLTAPSAWISRCSRSISPCRPARRTLPSVMLCATAARSAWASSSSWLYCSTPRRAACSLSWKSVMRLRSGSSSRSSCRRRSSLARSLAVSSSYWLRSAPSACSRSSFMASAFCRPACAAASFSRPSSSAARCCSSASDFSCVAAVSIARCSSLWRACRLRKANTASCAVRSSERCCSRAWFSARSASITLSSSWAWRSWLSASCMSSSSKRASAVTPHVLCVDT
eukprot:Opistho-1_new@67441